MSNRPIVFWVVILLLAPTLLFSQKDVQYPVRDIDPALFKYTPAVIRDYRTTLQVHSPATATKSVYYAVTILNSDGNYAAALQIYYDRLSKATFKGGKIYDATGQLVQKIKANELEDISAISSISVYEDNRRLVYQPTRAIYPYTVVYEYETSLKGLVHWLNWYPQTALGYSVEAAQLEVSMPENISGRFRSVYLKEAAPVQADGRTTYRWELQNQPALKDEALSPNATELLPHVIAAPNDFAYDGYAGSIETWDKLAAWIRILQADRDQLPTDTRATLHALTDALPSTEEKVKVLYQYLQDNFRYVSIQLGIGGFMPFSAEFVDEKKYGDCKALSNYMQAMLSEMDIRSHYTLVRAGRETNDILPDFPAQQFNHAILCVPLNQDTMWLECTSQTAPVGFLSDFTSDRHVLLVTETGGKVVRTPRYTATHNRIARRADIQLDATGKATVDMHTRFSGLSYSEIDHAIRKGKTKETFAERYSFSGLDIANLDLKVEKGPIPEGIETAHFSLDRYASKSGKRIFMKINPCPASETRLSTDEDRQHDLVFRQARSRRDTFAYRIPQGYAPEYLPEPVIAESPFGQYSFTVTEAEDQLLCIRAEDLHQGRFPASDLGAYLDFRKTITKADKQKIVLVKKEE